MISFFDAVFWYEAIRTWTNENQGLLSIGLFLITAVFGWVSGIFSGLRRKPKLKLALIPGPTFCCTFNTGERSGSHDIHRTGFALYIKVSNVGSAATSLQQISVAYRPKMRSYLLRWHWLDDQVAALADFWTMIGEQIKLYPFLTQASFVSGQTPETFLEVGASTNGVVYFEQADSWGALRPVARSEHVRVKVRIHDVFGGRHTGTFRIPMLSFEEARKFNPAFGRTRADLRGQTLPMDSPNPLPEEASVATNAPASKLDVQDPER